MKQIVYSLITAIVIVIQSCGVYNFTGGSIPPEMKTVSVQFFENNAQTVVPYLSTQFTEALKERIRNQSSLSMVRTEGDATFEGRFTNYSITPAAIQGNTRAGLNRLTVTVNVKYTNTINTKDSFEQSFTVWREFSTASQSIQNQEPVLIRDIVRQLTEDIFNRAFANW
jgi:outer membrane lipopolysaccharide assembly protein LptE/RlpB